MQFMDNLDLVVNVPVSFHVVTLDINSSQQVLIKGARVSAFQNKACVFVEILLCGHFTNAELLWAQLGEKKNLDVHIQSQRLCYTKPGCLWVSIWAVRPMAVMHVCICVHCLCACASFSMCMHMHACVCWLPNVESRKRKRLDGWRGVYLFITQRPPWFQGDMATLVLGPSALVCLWPALALPKPSALTSSAPFSLLRLLFILFHLDPAQAFTVAFTYCVCACTVSFFLLLWLFRWHITHCKNESFCHLFIILCWLNKTQHVCFTCRCIGESRLNVREALLENSLCHSHLLDFISQPTSLYC